MTRLNRWTLTLLLLPTLASCKAGDPEASDSNTASDSSGSDDTAGTPTTGEPMDCEGISIPAIDESACMPLADDYQPRTNPDNDGWPACIGDEFPYVQVDAKTPGSAARIEAYEQMGKLLWDNPNTPTVADFTAARDQYVIAEGLASRVNRREDLHYPPIPEAEWQDGVDGDKQCTVSALAMKYVDRCVGPNKMAPIVEGAFDDAQLGDKATIDPRINAAKIHATIEWFLYLSVYKEAETCGSEDPADCDSSWAYYTGLEGIESGKGFSKDVLANSKNAHERIHDGIHATRCWRELTKTAEGEYPFFKMLPEEDVALFERGWEQLDQALHRGFAVVVRQHAEAYLDGICGTAQHYRPAAWAYLQIAGAALQREADERGDATQAKVLADLWAKDSPTAQEVADGIAALDAIFPCP